MAAVRLVSDLTAGVTRRPYRRTAALMLAYVLGAGSAAAGDAAGPPTDGRAGVAQSQQSDRVAQVLDAFSRTQGDERVRMAADIFFNNPEAKLALKRDPVLGRMFHDVMAGPDGASGLAGEALESFRRRMKAAGYSDALVNSYALIRNQSSVGRAPIDIDVGALATSEAERAALRKLIGGPAEVQRLHQTSQRLLEEAWSEVVQLHGLTPPAPTDLRHWLAATTPWHPEAYLASQVLKEGGIPGRSLLQQTADVTKFKINHWAGAVGAGNEWAVIEMARATLKDVPKVERVYAEVGRLTGTRPGFKDPGFLDLLRRLERAPDRRAAMTLLKEAKLSVTSLAEECKTVADQFESAVRGAPPAQILKARFYATRLSGEALQQALRAVVDRDKTMLPAVARAVDDELAKVSGLYLISLDPIGPETFVRRLAAQWPGGAASLRLGADDAAIRQFLGQQLERLPEAELAVWFDPESTRRLSELRGRMTPEVKRTLAAKISTRLPAAEVDRRITTTLLAGDAQKAGGGAHAARGLLFFDGVIGAATALLATSAIMDEGLPPEVERRRIADAWTMAIPVIGDAYAAAGSMGAGGWQYLDGVLHVALAVSYFVPQVQVAAVVATLGLAAYSVGTSLHDVDALRRHIGTWVASGAFDPSDGRLMGIYDAEHSPRQALRRMTTPRAQADEDRRALDLFYVNGDLPYCCLPPFPVATVGGHAGAAMPQVPTLRASLLDFAERAFRVSRDPNVEATRTAITAAYPSFDIDAALAQPRDLGRLALEKIIRADNATPTRPPTRTPAWALYRQLERIYEEAALAAIRRLTADAAREYQATHMVGEAAAVFARLNTLGGRLSLPLLKHVDEIHNSCFGLVKGVWDEHSRPVQRLDLAKTFADGYAAIETSISDIGELCRRYGVSPPSKYWLSGFLEIDRPRIADLERAYRLAITTAEGDLKWAAATLKIPYDRSDPCQGKIFRDLAQQQVTIVYARDYELLLSEWAGSVDAAERSRNEALARIQSALDRDAPVSSVLTKELYEAQELVLGWRRERWADQGVFAEGAEAFKSAGSAARATCSRLEIEYSTTLSGLGGRLSACVAAPSSIKDKPATQPPAAKPPTTPASTGGPGAEPIGARRDRETRYSGGELQCKWTEIKTASGWVTTGASTCHTREGTVNSLEAHDDEGRLHGEAWRCLNNGCTGKTFTLWDHGRKIREWTVWTR